MVRHGRARWRIRFKPSPACDATADGRFGGASAEIFALPRSRSRGASILDGSFCGSGDHAGARICKSVDAFECTKSGRPRRPAAGACRPAGGAAPATECSSYRIGSGEAGAGLCDCDCRRCAGALVRLFRGRAGLTSAVAGVCHGACPSAGRALADSRRVGGVVSYRVAAPCKCAGDSRGRCADLLPRARGHHYRVDARPRRV